jgi:hypothetical protein
MEAKTIGNIIRIQQPNPARKTNSNKCKKCYYFSANKSVGRSATVESKMPTQKTHSKIEKGKRAMAKKKKNSLSLSLSLSPSPVVVFFVFVALVDD